jgi:hypothetical protein
MYFALFSRVLRELHRNPFKIVYIQKQRVEYRGAFLCVCKFERQNVTKGIGMNVS